MDNKLTIDQQKRLDECIKMASILKDATEYKLNKSFESDLDNSKSYYISSIQKLLFNYDEYNISSDNKRRITKILNFLSLVK